MLSTRNIIYGFCTSTTPQKYKYLISLYRDGDSEVLASFTTSLKRSGGKDDSNIHGVVKRNGSPVSYVFSTSKKVGVSPDGTPFSFPMQTTVTFDYCIKTGSQESILKQFVDPRVECTLNVDEYENLLYAMYKSKDTDKKYISILERALFAIHEKNV